MKRIYILSALLILYLSFSSCKKGEDDPAFTLLSRKKRVEGNWKMSEGSVTLGFKDASGIYPIQIFKLKETGYTRDNVGNGAHFEGKHSLILNLTKKGSFIMKQVIDSLSVEFSGTWIFEGKTGDSKNKEKINFQLNKVNSILGIYRLFNKSQTNFRYRIKELRSKRMVLTCKEEMLDLNSSYGIYATSEYTFVQ